MPGRGQWENGQWFMVDGQWVMVDWAGTLKTCYIIAQGATLGENPGKEGHPNPHYEKRETREKDREEAFAYDSRLTIR